MLDLAGQNRRMLIRGGAGTGKSVLARELCLRRAAAGEQVRYLCFTDALARHMDASFVAARKSKRNIKAHAIRRLAAGLTGSTPAMEATAQWDALPLRAMEALPPSLKPALTVVDEAQDLSDSDWQLVLAIAGDRDLWVFEDPAQQFWPERALPPELAGLPSLELSAQHRLPTGLSALAAAYRGGPAPEKCAEVVVVAADERPTAHVVREVVEQVLLAGVSPEHVAVLSLAGRERSKVLSAGALAPLSVAAADNPAAGSSVVADTVLRFKGLERAVVVICELATTPHRYDLRMHIALTRATAQVFVVASAQALQNDARLRGLTGSV